MGLPGSGKTTLSEYLAKELKAKHFNADKIREQFNDWDFTKEGRLRQAKRMKELADNCKISICDFVCPLPEMREIFDADVVIWMDTIKAGRFTNTNKIFVAPEEYDLRFTSLNSSNIDIALNYLLSSLKEKKHFKNNILINNSINIQ